MSKILCLHENFECEVAVARLVDDDRPLRFQADVTIRCAGCGQSFMFQGVDDVGFRFDKPSTDVSSQTLSVPIAPWDGRIATNATYQMRSAERQP